MAKLLSDLTKEELESICREQNCDIYILVESKKKVLAKNELLVAFQTSLVKANQLLANALSSANERIDILEEENAKLIMLCRKHGLI